MVLEGKAKATCGEEDLAMFLWEPVFQRRVTSRDSLGLGPRMDVSVSPVKDSIYRPARRSCGYQHSFCWVFPSLSLCPWVAWSCSSQSVWSRDFNWTKDFFEWFCETNIIFKITLRFYFYLCFYHFYTFTGVPWSFPETSISTDWMPRWTWESTYLLVWQTVKKLVNILLKKLYNVMKYIIYIDI